MEDHFFSYNAIQKTWQETNCHGLSGTLAEYVPQIILIENKEQMVWCPIHHTYETVETLSHSKVSTTDGCILSGAVIPIGAIDITADQDARRDLFDLRWHISQERSRGRLMIAVDRVVIGLGDGYDNRLGRVLVPHVYGRSFHSISVAYVKEKIIEIGLCQKIPTTILITALTKLQGIAEEYYGEKMPFSWEKIVSYGQYSDPECLKAMLHYPFSPILWLMRNYFNINENYRIVTRDDRRGFSKICEALQLVSNEAFLSQVLKNPYTFILNLRLRRSAAKKWIKDWRGSMYGKTMAYPMTNHFLKMMPPWLHFVRISYVYLTIGKLFSFIVNGICSNREKMYFRQFFIICLPNGSHATRRLFAPFIDIISICH